MIPSSSRYFHPPARFQTLDPAKCNEYIEYYYHIIHKEQDMEKRISANMAARDFSEVLNSIKFKDVHYIIERGGKPIASMKDPMRLSYAASPTLLAMWGRSIEFNVKTTNSEKGLFHG